MKENRILNTVHWRPLPGRAFTLLEMLAALAVLAVLVGWGFPSIQQSIRNNQVAAQNNELVALFAFTRSEAIRRNTGVPILLTAFDGGWDAIVEDPSNEADVEGCVPGQLRCSSNTRVNLIASTGVLNDGLVFNNRGYIRGADDAWTGETIYLQHESCSGQRQRRRIDIMPTGQISSCSVPCESTAACPP